MFVFGRNALRRGTLTHSIAVNIAITLLAACASAAPDPLQSAIATPTAIPTAVRSPVPAGTGIVAVTFTPNPQPAAGSTVQSASATPGNQQVGATATTSQQVAPEIPSGTATQTNTPAPTPTAGTPGTPDTRLTSTSVVATITALAASPTYPPTTAPRANRRPQVPIGAAGDAVPPTTIPSKTGVTVQTISERVTRGGTATLTIKTKPKATCELSYIRASSDGKGEILEPISAGATRNAGSDGVIAWIWTIDKAEPTGALRLIIHCGAAGINQVQMQVN